jgi:hypothetical protein
MDADKQQVDTDVHCIVRVDASESESVSVQHNDSGTRHGIVHLPGAHEHVGATREHTGQNQDGCTDHEKNHKKSLHGSVTNAPQQLVKMALTQALGMKFGGGVPSAQRTRTAVVSLPQLEPSGGSYAVLREDIERGV